MDDTARKYENKIRKMVDNAHAENGMLYTDKGINICAAISQYLCEDNNIIDVVVEDSYSNDDKTLTLSVAFTYYFKSCLKIAEFNGLHLVVIQKNLEEAI